MTEEGDTREQLGRIESTLKTQCQELALLRVEVKNISRKVEQHSTGWQIFMWIGGAGIAVAALVAAFLRS